MTIVFVENEYTVQLVTLVGEAYPAVIASSYRGRPTSL